MIKVTLNGSLRSKAGGQAAFEVEATSVRELFEKLGEQVPALKPVLDGGVVVAIDNVVYREALYKPLPPDCDVHLLPKLAGG